MLQALKYLSISNIWGLLSARLKFKKFIIFPYRNTYLKFAKTSTLKGNGKILLGVQWKDGRYFPSQMVVRDNGQIRVHGRFRINTNHNIWINENARLSLGSGFINNGLNLSCYSHIKIGNDVRISENVTIRDSDNHSFSNEDVTQPITIGNNVWIGIGVTILKGVHIGDGAMIAAGAVVNKDIPAHTLAAGVPAKIKKENIKYYKQN